MATQNLVSASLPAAEKLAIQAAIQTITQKLPFLISLTAGERMGGLKLGDKTVAFVDKAIDYANSNSTLVPSFVNLVEIQKDYQLQKDLIDIEQWIMTLLQKIQDTYLEAGAETFNGILGFYQSVSLAADKNVPGARAIYDDLSTRFPGRRKPANPAVVPQNN